MDPDKEIALLNVRCKFETNYWRVYDEYRARYKRPLLAAKIFSRHEAAGAFDADPDILKKLILAVDGVPKQRMEWPETENQWYGWFTTPLIEKEPLAHFPRPTTEISRIGSIILAEQIQTKTKKKK